MDKADPAVVRERARQRTNVPSFDDPNLRTIMDGWQVVEVTNVGRPAWIALNLPDEKGDYERDIITFDLHKAHIFTEWFRARDTVSRLRCGYPQWECRYVEYTDKYRMRFAKDTGQEFALPGHQIAIPLIKSGEQNGQG